MEYKQYDSFTDEELILMLRDGDKAVQDYLCDKYKDMAKYKAKSMYILGGEPEDLIQEGMIGLFKAVRDYDPEKEASFKTFAQLCVARQMYKAVQAAKAKKQSPLNMYVSLNGNNDPEETKSIMDTLATTLDFNPEDIFIGMEVREELKKRIDEELSSLEKQVFELKLTGMSMNEIASVLGKEKKSIDNAIQRMNTKVSKIVAGMNSEQ